ncbi:MAG: thymidine phosphorylase [Christensenellales bacterium]
MRAYDVIRNKRDGKELSTEEINFFVENYVSGVIPDYQAAAFCMAVYFSGMNERETADFTFAVRDSGEKPDFSAVKGIRVDKHSTGGVGDKTSLIVIPVVAACGLKVAKMSGRGLGHTGGTIDKLESIPDFRTEMSAEEIISVVNSVGMAIVGQSERLAPADKKLYALRDVTATVDSIPLIAASIMGKKLAVGDDCILLDVKTGSGAFMKNREEAEKLARVMTDIGKRAGKKTVALITDMDRPLGNAIGNALEMREALGVLNGTDTGELYDFCVALAAEMLVMAGKGSFGECEKLAAEAIKSGKALKTFAAAVKAQGGDESAVFCPDKLQIAKFSREVKATDGGYITATNAEEYGAASVALGAGRNKAGDKIDLGAGIILNKKVGDAVKKGDTIAWLYASDEKLFAEAEKRILRATKIGRTKPIVGKMIIEKIY